MSSDLILQQRFASLTELKLTARALLLSRWELYLSLSVYLYMLYLFGFSNCGTRAQLSWRAGLVAPQRVGSQFPNQGLNPRPLHCKVNSFLFFFLMFLFLVVLVFCCACGLSLVVAGRGYSSLLCTGFSLWRLLLAEHMACELSSWGWLALGHRLNSCGSQAQLLCGMWDLLGPGIEPLSPELADRFLSTVPPEKSLPCILLGSVSSAVRAQSCHILL